MKTPFFIPIICFIFGIAIAGIFAAGLHGNIVLTVLVTELALIIGAIFISKKYIFYVLLCVYFLTLGIFRFSTFSDISEKDISSFVTSRENECLVYGAIITEPEQKKHFGAEQYVFLLNPKKVLIEKKEHDVNGIIQIRLFSKYDSPEIGDVIFIGGKIKSPGKRTNPYQFDYKKHLKTKGIRAVLSSKGTDHYFKTGELKGISFRIRKILSKWRNKASEIIDEEVGGISGAVFKAVILGLRGDIPVWVNDVFIRTGTMHILAISGLHIGILMFIVFKFLRFLRISINISSIFTICFILLFAVFAGARSSLMRAAIMGTFLMLGVIAQRNISSIYTLLFSAFVLLFIYPGQIFDTGFILSYCAVLSILFIVPFVDSFFDIEVAEKKRTRFEDIKFKIYQLFSMSVSVWLGIMPLIAFYFGILTPFVFLINFIAIPFLFLIIILGICFFAFCLIPVGAISAVPAFLLRESILVFLGLLTGFVKMPMSFVKVATPVTGITIVYYAILFAVIFLPGKDNRKKKVLFPAFILLAAILFICSEISAKTPVVFTATFFDVEKADAALLEFSDNSVVLIDGGNGEGLFSKDAGKKTLEPYLRNKGIRSIDAIILSHPHADHIGGLFYIIDNFKVGCIVTADWKKIFKNNDIAGESDSMEMFRKIRKISLEKGIKMIYVESGDRIEGIKDISFEVFNPDIDEKYSDFNNPSVVVKMTDKYNNSILFCGDAEEQAIKDILCFGDRIKADYVKFPHHGGCIGKKAVIDQFLSTTDCVRYIITNKSRKAINPYVEEALKQNSIDYFVLGEDGAVTINRENETLRIRGQ